MAVPIHLDDLSQQVRNQSCDLLRHLLGNNRSQLGINTFVVFVVVVVGVVVVVTFLLVFTSVIVSATTWRHDP